MRALSVILTALYIVFAVTSVCLVAGGYVSFFQVMAAFCMLIGVTCLAVRNKNERIINGKNVTGAILVLFGSGLFLLEKLCGLSYAVYLMLVGVECIFICIIAMSIIRIVRCNTSVTAKYCGIENSSKGYCTAVFEYTFCENFYKGKCNQLLRQRYIEKHFSKGEYYNIFADPAKPSRIIIKRRLLFVEYLIMLYAAWGAFCLVYLIV